MWSQNVRIEHIQLASLLSPSSHSSLTHTFSGSSSSIVSLPSLFACFRFSFTCIVRVGGCGRVWEGSEGGRGGGEEIEEERKRSYNESWY